MTSGSVITETIFISDPHAGPKSGSISKIRRRSRCRRSSTRRRKTSSTSLVSLLCECAVGDEGMHVGVEVGGVGAERLDRDDQARCDVPPVEDRTKARNDGVAGRAGEQAEQAPLALEQPEQDARNREHDVAVRDGLEDLRDDVLREQRRALGLVARTEVTCPAGEGEQVLGPAVGDYK